ncbi:MAG: 2'-5' RNA ligase family protein [Treponema sp.]|nr:2'-5' RNA ligase family protein [Treponema sp.]
MKQNSFVRQTHFVGVLLPDDLTLTLEDCRRYMREAYACRSGQATPIHVTLVPPFLLPEQYRSKDLAAVLADELSNAKDAEKLSFTARVEGFDAFGDRTLFAKVLACTEWTRLRDRTLKAVLNAFPGSTRKDQRPFQPHLTVANRDIPPGVMTDALQSMRELNLAEDFPVDNITVFERIGGLWKEACRIPLD